MTLIRTIISDALREGGILALGDTPDAPSETEGLRRLSVIIRSLIGSELGELLHPVNYGDNGLTEQTAIDEDAREVIDLTYIPGNSRLIANLPEASSVFLNPRPRAGERLSILDVSGNFATRNLTVKGNGRKIEGTTEVVLATNGLSREWFYRDDLADWVRVTDLTLNDESPFPLEFDDLLTVMLAIRLNPRFGQTLSQEAASVLSRDRNRFRARYRQSAELKPESGFTLKDSGTNWHTN